MDTLRKEKDRLRHIDESRAKLQVRSADFVSCLIQLIAEQGVAERENTQLIKRRSDFEEHMLQVQV